MPGPYAVRVRTPDGWQDIAMIGPQGVQGPNGPQGASGTAIVSEQPSPPASPVIGQLWIDTDDPVPQGPVLGPPLASSLPASPYDGQEIRYLADATNGIIWHLRYRAGSSSAYKWEFVGGSDYNVEAGSGGVNPGISVWSTLGTSNPFTAPLAGDYDIEYGALFQGGAATSVNMGLSLNGGTPAIRTNGYISAASAWASPSTRQTATLGASQTAVIQYNISVSAFMTKSLSWLRVRPVRVG